MSTAIDDAPPWALRLLEAMPVARLGLLDYSGRPRVLPVTFALHEGALWTAIDRKPKADPNREPARLGFLRRRPEVALTVDRYDDDWERLAWVQVLGRASLLGAAARPGAMAALGDKYRQYREQPPPGPLIRIDVERILTWAAQPPAGESK